MPSCGYPEKSAGLRFSLIFPTAAPTHAACPPPLFFRWRSALLRCPKYGGATPYFDRCAILASLHLPLAALGDEARHARASDKFCLTKRNSHQNGDCFFLAGAEGLEPSARGFGVGRGLMNP